MDRDEVLQELDETIRKLNLTVKKMMDLRLRSNVMSAEEIMREMLIILSFGDEPLENKPSIIV